MDFNRLSRTNIPDLAQVYGGARGRTMSSRHQNYAWPALVESGITQVIDLRKTDSSEKLPRICDNYGIAYFHYPVDNDKETIVRMVELLPELCKRIDKGNFYIACAMGLHRTDIALCVYWVFYAADRGIEPPILRGYTAKVGLTTDRIMRILNAIYLHLTEVNNIAPFPVEVFKDRKKVIHELNKNS